MHRITRSKRCWIALAIWAMGLLLFVWLGWWQISAFRADAENRLIGEAGRVAAQLASLLSYRGARLDATTARAISVAAMEDERVYAVRVDTGKGLLAGMRRNYLWEPIPWDEEINENCIQGMNPIRIGGKHEGKVEIWLSPRLSDEEEALFLDREGTRFIIITLVWTGCLCLLLWYWGDFRRLLKRWKRALPEEEQPGQDGENLLLGLTPQQEIPKCEKPETGNLPCYVDPRAAYDYQKKNPEAWLITAGLFRQTFARAPGLLTRLYAAGEVAGLCHLGRMLELASPCIGALPLQSVAQRMQQALNDPYSETRAIPVEECVEILEKTLAVLGGANIVEKKDGA